MTWWKEGIIYQIYPRSFRDSNGDGIGDIRGIIDKLDYVASLGVDIIWLNPVFESPNDDNGYDISDYYSIHPEFGSMKDFDELLESIHNRGMRLLMDLVVNHTSDEHAWFLRSKENAINPYHDFYFWLPGKEGGPPNNWISFFGGSAWEYEPDLDAYYLHLFTRKQPDLNWENEQVRKEVQDITRFWLDKGIDGFRLDVIPLISKRLDFPEADLSDFGKVIETVYSNGPRVHEYLQELNKEVFSNYDMMTVGEGPGITQKTVNDYVAADRKELDMIFHLDHMSIDHGLQGRFDPVPFDLPAFKEIFSSWDQAVGDRGWLSIFLDNHDFPRMVSRFGNDGQFRVESSKLLAMLILTMRGTPCIYFGSEIGMTNVAFDSIVDYRDVETLNYYEIYKQDSDFDELDFLSLVHRQGRDNVRTPMQWDGSAHAGFTTGEPWIKLNSRYTEINVENDLASDASIRHFYRDLVKIRKAHPALVYGEFELLYPDHPQLFAYLRTTGDESFLILLNFSEDQMEIPTELYGYKEVIGNYRVSHDHEKLKSWEARLLTSH